MSDSVNITFIITSEFNADALKKFAEGLNATSRKTANEHQISFWSINGLSIIQYEKNLVIQGSLNKFTKAVLRDLANLKGLTTDAKNNGKLHAIFPVRQNAIVCGRCNEDSLMILGQIEGLDVKFSLECKHPINLIAPFMTLNNRVLPDINMFLSKSVSRLIGIGHLKGVEIVFPEFILDIVDQFKGAGSKGAVSEELDSLRKIAKGGDISINTFPNLPFTRLTKAPEDEDKVILDFAHFTNSIIMTGDKVLTERALMECRPTIYIHPEDFGKLKMIDEVRTKQKTEWAKINLC